MAEKDLGFMAVTVLAAVAAAIFIWSQSQIAPVWRDIDIGPVVKAPSTPLADHDRTFQNDLYNFQMTVPKDWYLHERLDGAAILTKRKGLVMPKETESWAIGEQMMISISALEDSYGKITTPEKWAAKNIPTKNINNKPITQTWESSAGDKTLRVEQIAAGTSNQLLSYYIFYENNIFIFNLYPYDLANAGNIEDFEEMVKSSTFSVKAVAISSE